MPPGDKNHKTHRNPEPRKQTGHQQRSAKVQDYLTKQKNTVLVRAILSDALCTNIQCNYKQNHSQFLHIDYKR